MLIGVATYLKVGGGLKSSFTNSGLLHVPNDSNKVINKVTYHFPSPESTIYYQQLNLDLEFI